MSHINCAAILAGGKSSRMGREKALLELSGELLVRRIARVLEPIFPRVVVVTNSAEVARAAQLPAVADAHLNKGPLAGIEAALLYFQTSTFIVACDLPHLNADFVRFQIEGWREELDALVPLSEQGLEPLHAVWAPSCLTSIQNALKEERPPSLRRVLSELNVGEIALEQARRFDAHLRFFENWNRPEDVSNC